MSTNDVFKKMTKQNVLEIANSLNVMVEAKKNITKTKIINTINEHFPSFSNDQIAGIDIACKRIRKQSFTHKQHLIYPSYFPFLLSF